MPAPVRLRSAVTLYAPRLPSISFFFPFSLFLEVVGQFTLRPVLPPACLHRVPTSTVFDSPPCIELISEPFSREIFTEGLYNTPRDMRTRRLSSPFDLWVFFPVNISIVPVSSFSLRYVLSLRATVLPSLLSLLFVPALVCTRRRCASPFVVRSAHLPSSAFTFLQLAPRSSLFSSVYVLFPLTLLVVPFFLTPLWPRFSTSVTYHVCLLVVCLMRTPSGRQPYVSFLYDTRPSFPFFSFLFFSLCFYVWPVWSPLGPHFGFDCKLGSRGSSPPLTGFHRFFDFRTTLGSRPASYQAATPGPAAKF